MFVAHMQISREHTAWRTCDPTVNAYHCSVRRHLSFIHVPQLESHVAQHLGAITAPAETTACEQPLHLRLPFTSDCKSEALHNVRRHVPRWVIPKNAAENEMRKEVSILWLERLCATHIKQADLLWVQRPRANRVVVALHHLVGLHIDRALVSQAPVEHREACCV